MLFRESVAVYCEKHKEHVSTLCVERMQFAYVNIRGTCRYHCAPTSPSCETKKERVVVRFLFGRILLRMPLLCFRESSWTLLLKMGQLPYHRVPVGVRFFSSPASRPVLGSTQSSIQ
jgi:hypothetical protein